MRGVQHYENLKPGSFDLEPSIPAIEPSCFTRRNKYYILDVQKMPFVGVSIYFNIIKDRTIKLLFPVRKMTPRWCRTYTI